MKKFCTLFALVVFAISVSADVIWSESLDMNGSYINKADFSNNWPYVTQWYGKGNFIYEYDSVGSYSCSVRNKKLNGDTENSIGFFFGANKAADQCYLYLGGKEGAIVEGAVGCKLMFDICSSESNGGDLSTMAVTVNGTTFPTVDLALGNKLVTSPVEFNLPDGDIEYIKISFDNVPSQKFIAHLRIEGEGGTAHGTNGFIPPVEIRDTLSGKEALAEIANIDKGMTTVDYYVVKGYINEIITPYDPQSGSMSFMLGDKFNSRWGILQCSQAKISRINAEKAVEGAYVYVLGNLKNEASNPQVVQGRIIIAEAPKIDTVAITVAQALELVAPLNKGEGLDTFYAVTGYVVETIEYYDEGTQSFQSFWMSDSKTADEGDLYIDMVKIANGAPDHQKICVYGWLDKDGEGDARILNGEAVFVPEEATGITNIILPEKVQKVVVDGVMYIVRDGKLFSIQGAQVR